jgi:hypothetical protein
MRILKGTCIEYSLEPIDANMGSWAANTAANVSADTLSFVNM